MRYHVYTVSFTSLKGIYDLYYPKYNNYKKVVPLEIIHFLTPLGLAVWIMDDGSALNKGVKLATHCFSLEECNYLRYVLKERYQLKTSLHEQGINSKGQSQYIIYIWKESIPRLREIVNPYIIPEMQYKITADLKK